jgi:hypothetical protein
MRLVNVRAAAAAGVVTVVASAWLTPRTASGQSGQFSAVRPVITESTASPDTPRIGEIAAQAINNSGQVAFSAYYDDPNLPHGAFGPFVAGGNPTQPPRLVARQAMPAPGTGASFGTSGVAGFNHRGEVLFSTGLQGGDVDPFYRNSSALYVGTPAGQQLVAREGDAVPDGTPGLVYRPSSSGGPFGGLMFNHAGQAGYVSLLSGPGVDVTNSTALFAGAPGNVRMLVRANDPSPVPGMNWGGSFTTSIYPRLSPVMNDSGQVLFRSTLREAASGNLTTQTGVFMGSTRENISTVLLNGDPAPDAPAGWGVWTAGTNLAVNNAGQVAVGATIYGPDGTGAAALYQGTPEALRTVFRTGDPAPQTTPGVTFTDLYHGAEVVMNASGKVAFSVYLEGADAVGSFHDHALYTGTPGDLDLIARAGDHAPGTPDNVVFRNLYGVALNAPGQVAFLTGLGIADSDQSAGQAIYGFDPQAGLSLLARAGDQFDLGEGRTGTVRAFAFNDGSGGQDGRLISINDLGQVAFTMGFAEGGSGGAITEGRGLFLASIVPEPSAALAGVAFGAAALLRRRRPR